MPICQCTFEFTEIRSLYQGQFLLFKNFISLKETFPCNVRPCYKWFTWKGYPFRPYQTNTSKTSNDCCLFCLVRRWLVDQPVSLQLLIYNALACHPFQDRIQVFNGNHVSEHWEFFVEVIFCQNKGKKVKSANFFFSPTKTMR